MTLCEQSLCQMGFDTKYYNKRDYGHCNLVTPSQLQVIDPL